MPHVIGSGLRRKQRISPRTPAQRNKNTRNEAKTKDIANVTAPHVEHHENSHPTGILRNLFTYVKLDEMNAKVKTRSITF